MDTPHQDKALIDSLGGPAKVAELMGIDKNGGVQRIHNWETRGIPSSVKVARPDLFMPELTQRPDTTPEAPATTAETPLEASHAA